MAGTQQNGNIKPIWWIIGILFTVVLPTLVGNVIANDNKSTNTDAKLVDKIHLHEEKAASNLLEINKEISVVKVEQMKLATTQNIMMKQQDSMMEKQEGMFGLLKSIESSLNND